MPTKSHHGSDRQIDAAGDDHQHLPHAHDGDEGEVAAVVVEIVIAAERLRDQSHHDANDENRKRDRRGLTEPHNSETARGRRGDFSLRGHGPALSGDRSHDDRQESTNSWRARPGESRGIRRFGGET